MQEGKHTHSPHVSIFWERHRAAAAIWEGMYFVIMS